MATQYLQLKANIPDEIKAAVVQIPSSTVQVQKPDLEDNQKRWLVVGICANSIITPALRFYVEPIVTNLYRTLKSSNNIHSQTYPNYMKKYPSTNQYTLNYEAINNNASMPKVRGKPNYANFNYNVQNAVDFSKLFLQTHMAKYTGFDDTCDASALLGLLINIDKFPANVKTVATKVRSDIRNPWAHCNFSEWDNIKYLNAFQLMHQLVKNFGFTQHDENRFISKLSQWEMNGLNFMEGTTIGLEVLQSFKQETTALAKYFLMFTDEADKRFELVHKELLSINTQICSITDRVTSTEETLTQQQEELNLVSKGVLDLQIKSATTEHRMDESDGKVKELEKVIKDTDKSLAEVRSGVEEHFNTIQEDTKISQLKITEITEDIDAMKTDIENLKYNLHTKPEGRAYFYPPDRISHFVGRKYELGVLQRRFIEKRDEGFTQVVCGLGGIGKSTLAVEFSWQFQKLYPGGIFWLSAESIEILETTISQLAIDINCKGKDSKETLSLTLRWLLDLESKWLLVIDNVDSDDITGNMKELLLGIWRRQSKGHVLITSRREPKEVENSLLIDETKCIYLEVLSRKEGAEFLSKRSGNVCTVEDGPVSELVDELGGLPLALEQAAAFIKSIKCTFEQYLERFLKERQKLLNKRRVTIQGEIGKERLTVKTTWLLNMHYIEKQSEEEDLGSAPVKVMEIVSFFYPDEIPIELLNEGSPKVDDEDICDKLEDGFDRKQVTDVLTRFSLFQQRDETTLSVHRLVQEVIRDGIKDKAMVLKHALRMVNKALESTTSPFGILSKSRVSTKGNLYLWSKIAMSATSLREHISKISEIDSSMHFNLEATNVIHASAVFHSIHQRQDKALAEQEQLLSIMTSVDIPPEKCNEYISVKIPLLEKDRTLLQNSLSFAFTQSHDDKKVPCSNASDTLQKLGNDAYKENRFHDAIHFYSKYIKITPQEGQDIRAFLNRGSLYIKVKDYKNALEDAETCIQMDPKSWKGYCLKAYSIDKMIKHNQLPPAFEMVGLASASIAAHLNEDCLIDYRMKIAYPIVVYKVLTCNDDLSDAMATNEDLPHTTLLLQKGTYYLHDPAITTKSIQIIGIEDGVEIACRSNLRITRPPDELFLFRFKRETIIHAHFENVTFLPENGQISVTDNALATFYKCKLSNGMIGCEDFPRCEGRKGCIVNPPCSREDSWKWGFANLPTGEPGFPAIWVGTGGHAIIDRCILQRCGGGGVLADGDNSLLEIKYSTVERMRQMGIEARNGGKIVAENNVIINNQFHGIAIAPRGFGIIRSNVIQGNGQEGIFCGGILDFDGAVTTVVKMSTEMASTAVISDNIITQNGISGMSLDGGTYEVTGNKIIGNWLWGMMIKSRSSVYLVKNMLSENKCGGVRIGTNYSATVIIDGNTFTDHSGPDIFAMNSEEKFVNFKGKKDIEKFTKAMGELELAEEPSMYTRPPFITNRNVRRNNNTGTQHPQESVAVFKACAYCFQSATDLKKCGRCKIASYCSRSCQKSHWKKHQFMCNLLQKEFIIKIQMKDTKPFQNKDDGKFQVRTFHHSLKGIREGPPPDRQSTSKFIVKVQTGQEYGPYDPHKELMLYDRSVTLDIVLSNPELYHLTNECGILAGNKLTTKKIFCYASFQDHGDVLNIHVDTLPPFQTW